MSEILIWAGRSVSLCDSMFSGLWAFRIDYNAVDDNAVDVDDNAVDDATGRHLPYGITQCYLPSDTSERTPAWAHRFRLVLDLPTPKGWKAELT